MKPQKNGRYDIQMHNELLIPRITPHPHGRSKFKHYYSVLMLANCEGYFETSLLFHVTGPLKIVGIDWNGSIFSLGSFVKTSQQFFTSVINILK